jgi:CDP-diacylglycerol--glycerol-3-phosphate 3-phosphatidyltransferase
MAAILPTKEQAIEHLRIQWAALAILLALSLGTGYVLFLTAWEPTYAWRWLSLASALSAYLLWVLWRGLPANHRPDETTLLPDLGAGNLLTLGRGALLAGLAGFLFSPRPPEWLAGYPGCSTPFASGFVRWLPARSNRVTRPGSADLSLDGLGY